MRVFFRSVLGWSVLIVGTLILSTLALLSLLIPRLGARIAGGIGRYLWPPLMIWASGANVITEGVENVDRVRPQVFVCNHQGMLDIVCLISRLPVNVRFVAKKQIAYVPLFGWYLKAVGHVFVDRRRHSAAVRSLDEAAERIRNGVNIVSFAEGTRTRTGRILPFKKGAFMLALKAGVPIVPCAIEGSYRVLPKGSMRVSPRDIRLKIGKPMPTAGLKDSDRDLFMRRVRDQIIDMHLSIGGLGGDRDNAIAPAGVEGLGESEPATAARNETTA
jgi:1-acyl-sn-glycerol-3-phosphate acyltransferase